MSLTSYGQAPALPLQHIGSEQGLQSSMVFHTVQDHQGLVWCCTYDGLYVYDGYRARKLDIRLCDTCPAQSTSVNHIFLDTQDNIWALTQLGAGKINRLTGVLRIIVPIAVCSNPASFYKDNDSILNIERFGAMPVLVNLFTEQYGFPHLISNGKRQALDYNADGRLYAKQNSSIFFYQNARSKLLQRIPGSFDFVPAQPKAVKLHKEAVEISHFEQADPLHRRWLKSETSMLDGYNFDVFDAAGNSIREKIFGHIGPFYSKDFIPDRAGNGWMNTNAGIIYFPKETGKPVALGDIYPQLKGDHIAEIRFDSNNVIWISTRGKGIYLADMRRQPFGHITESKSGGASLFRNFVLGFIPYRPNEILIQHEFGTVLNHTLLNYAALSTQLYVPPNKSMLESFKNAVTSLPGEASFISEVNALMREIPASLHKNIHQYFFIKKPGTPLYWHNQQDVYVHGNPKPLISISTPIGSRYQGDTLWIYTEDQGLFALHLPSSRIAHFKQNPDDLPHSLMHNRVHGVCFDKQGDVWAATSAGLSHYHKKTGLFTHYTTQQGLSHNIIYNITLDSIGQFWLGTGNGLSRFNPANNSFTNYYPVDGLINSEYNRNSAFTAPNGMVFMGGINGIDYLMPEDINGAVNPLQPLISLVQLPSKVLDPARQWNLSSTDNNLSFSFTVNDLTRAIACRYSYLLEGSETSQWQMLPTGHELQFANLKPGKYTLRVKAINQQGEISSTEAVFRFSIATPWYSSWWFMASIILVVALAAWWLLHYRQVQRIKALEYQNQLIRLQAEQALAIVQERDRITTDLHDDVGATLSSLNIYGDLANQVWESQPQESRKMIEKISLTSRQLMERMSDIIWSMKAGDETKYSLEARLRNYGNDLLAPRGIVCNFSMDAQLVALIKDPDLRKNLLLIAKEAFNNIAKYSGASQASIVLQPSNEAWLFGISDNGKGFDTTSSAASGNGLANIHLRCKNLNGECRILSSKGEGTRIECRFPMAIISHTMQP